MGLLVNAPMFKLGQILWSFVVLRQFLTYETMLISMAMSVVDTFREMILLSAFYNKQ